MTPAARTRPEHLFYDGGCGVCHWAVTFVARRDPAGAAFRFAPLGGETFRRLVPAPTDLPDSIVVVREDGAVLVRSRAAIHVLRRLGGFWRVLGALVWLVPAPLRDWGYDRFARIRHRLAARPEGSCPLLPPELAGRFDG